jgi:hypothetical protein
MLRKFLQYLPGIIVCLGFASTAQSLPLTYEFISTGGRVSSIAYTVDNVTVVATALATHGMPKVSPDARGLGIRTGGIKDHTREIDHVGAIETLRFTFDRMVELVSVVFSRVGFSDDFSVAIDGTTLMGSAPIPGSHRKDKGEGVFSFLSFPLLTRTGVQFDFTAPGMDDEYRVKGLTINAGSAPTNPVPEPSPVLLLGTGLVGLAGLGMLQERRQRSRNA